MYLFKNIIFTRRKSNLLAIQETLTNFVSFFNKLLELGDLPDE